MCRRPCWGTPDEIRLLIHRGLGDQLMLDYGELVDQRYAKKDVFRRVWVLCPANPDYGGRLAPRDEPPPSFLDELFDDLLTMAGLAPVPPIQSGCVFHKDNGRCALHGPHKPLAARLAHHSNNDAQNFAIYDAVLDSWDTSVGRGLVRRWKARFMKEAIEV